MTSLRNRILGTAVAFAALAAMPTSAMAQDDFDLSGKRIEMIVPLAEGGGADTYARFMAQRLGDYLPGDPSVIVRNIPGGGTVIGTNAFQSTASDGMTLFSSSGGVPLIWTFDRERPEVQFDPRTWELLLSSPLGYVVYANIEATGIDSLEDLKENRDMRLVYGMSTTKGSAILPLLSMQLLGLNVEPIFGVDGGDADLAFKRGEFHVNSDSMGAYIRNARALVEAGEIFPMFSYGYPDADGNIVRDPNVPDIPTFAEVYEEMHGEPPSGPGWEIWKKLFSMISLSSKSLAIKADTPDHIIAVYEKAIAEMVADPDFAADAEVHIGNYPQAIGDEAQSTLIQATSLSDEEVAWLAQWYLTNYGVEI